jgi:hypothetical protein
MPVGFLYSLDVWLMESLVSRGYYLSAFVSLLILARDISIVVCCLSSCCKHACFQSIPILLAFSLSLSRVDARASWLGACMTVLQSHVAVVVGCVVAATVVQSVPVD